MNFTDICYISSDVAALAEFYSKLFRIETELNHTHSYVVGPGLNIAIYSKTAAEKDGTDLTDAGRGMSFIGFNVDDVDIEYDRVKTKCKYSKQT